MDNRVGRMVERIALATLILGIPYSVLNFGNGNTDLALIIASFTMVFGFLLKGISEVIFLLQEIKDNL